MSEGQIQIKKEEILREIATLQQRKIISQEGPKTESQTIEIDFRLPFAGDAFVTATFADAAYARRFGFPLKAIDFALPQGTPIVAVAPGVVTKSEDAGLGYSSLRVAHNEVLETEYGHVSQLLVTEGETVIAGQLIGLSGGTPGTAGAGRNTTGPHLHFAVRANGTLVDPELFLPL